MRRAIIFFGMISLLAAGSAYATIIHVPGDYASIQSGINAAVDGDTVLVAPGDYHEEIFFLGKDIHVKSSDGPSVTSISRHMYQGTYTVTFYAGETENAILEGFNIFGGWDQVIYCYNSSPTIYGNIISTHQNFPWDSSLIRIYSAQPTIRKNKIVGIDDWQAPPYGIHGTNSAGAVIDSNDISIVGHGIFLQGCDDFTISRNIIHDNGNGITTNNLTDGSIINNSIVRNINGLSFGGGGNNAVLNNIIGFNNGLGIVGTTAEVVNYNNFWLNWLGNFNGINPGPNNVLADALFLNLDSLDLRLQYGSPCIDNGDPALPQDPDGTVSDIGAIFSDQRALIMGHITDFINNPIGNVQITTMIEGITTSSDPDGDFVMTGLTFGGHYDILFSHPGFADTVLIDIYAGYDDTTFIGLTMGNIQEDGSISGIVSDIDGIPIQDMLVTADISGSSDYTDQFGSYSIINLEPRHYYVSFSKPSFRDTSAIRVPVLAGQNTQLDITMTSLLSVVVTGIISNENMAPMEGIRVRIITADQETFTDEGGYYQIDSITGGLHIFNLFKSGFLNSTYYDVSIVWNDTVEVNFALDIPCEFVPGDANGNGSTNGLDVGYLVQWFKGAFPPPIRCFCPPVGFVYAGGDANGDCALTGVDVTYMVNYLKGGPNFPRGCPSCE